MNLKRNIFAMALVIVPTFGLISCSKDKPQSVVYDMWEDAPVLTVIQDDGQNTLAANEAATVLSSDSIQLSNGKTLEPSTAGVEHVEAHVTCQKISGTSFERHEALSLKESYKILDLLPIEALPAELENNGQTADVLCNLGLKLTNHLGSTRTRTVQNVLVHFDLSTASIELINAKGNSNEMVLTITNEDAFQTYLKSSQNTNGLYVLSCTDFQTQQSHSSTFKLSDLSINPDISIEGVDPRKAYPLQICRIYQRYTDSETHVSSEFNIRYPINSLKITATAAINEKWSEAYMHELNIIRGEIKNPHNYPVQVRVRKNVGSATLGVVSTSQSPFATHNRFVRAMTVSTDSEQIIDHDGYYYITIDPSSAVQVLYSINANIGCGHESSIAGMDFSFSNEELFTVEQIYRPLTINQMAYVRILTSSKLNLSNVFTGSGRENYYIPWQGSSSKALLSGPAANSSQPCW